MTTDSHFQMPCKTEMALLNQDCGFLPPPIKERKNPNLENHFRSSCLGKVWGPNGLAWCEGEGAGKRPIPDAEGRCPPLSQGPLAPHQGPGEKTSAIREQGWILAGPAPIPCHSLYPSLLPLPLSLSPQYVRRHARHTLRLSSAPDPQNSARKTKHLHETSASPFAFFHTLGPEASASVHKREGASVCEAGDTHPRAGSFLAALSS